MTQCDATRHVTRFGVTRLSAGCHARDSLRGFVRKGPATHTPWRAHARIGICTRAGLRNKENARKRTRARAAGAWRRGSPRRRRWRCWAASRRRAGSRGQRGGGGGGGPISGEVASALCGQEKETVSKQGHAHTRVRACAWTHAVPSASPAPPPSAAVNALPHSSAICAPLKPWRHCHRGSSRQCRYQASAAVKGNCCSLNGVRSS